MKNSYYHWPIDYSRYIPETEGGLKYAIRITTGHLASDFWSEDWKAGFTIQKISCLNKLWKTIREKTCQ